MRNVFTCLFLFPVVLIAQSLNFYFGNLHAHTAFSDGNKDSAASGVHNPAGSYAYAKLSMNCDFLGISEHNHYSSNHNPGFKLGLFAPGLQMAEAATQTGKFLALFGMEYGVSSYLNGHVLVYGYNQLLGWESDVAGTTGPNYQVFNAKSDYDGLFRKINKTPGAFCYLAHPNFTDYSVNGLETGALAQLPYNAAYDSAIVGLPLRSGLASNGSANYVDYPQGNYFNYYKKLLYNGYHLGIGYDHDNHYTNFGRGNAGRLVVMMPSLTKQNFFEAMRLMRFYGSDDGNAKIHYYLNGQGMGSIFSGDELPKIELKHEDPDGELADTIKVWRGSAGSGGWWAEAIHLETETNELNYTDQNLFPGREYYYFIEIRQKDGQWIMTSPIWYTGSIKMGSRTIESGLKFVCYPNPVKDKLTVSFYADFVGQIFIYDASGKEMLHAKYKGQHFRTTLNGYTPGIYTVIARTGNLSATQKIVIE